MASKVSGSGHLVNVFAFGFRIRGSTRYGRGEQTCVIIHIHTGDRTLPSGYNERATDFTTVDIYRNTTE